MVKQRKNIHTINNIKNKSEIYWISLNKDQVDILTINIKFEEKSLYPRETNRSHDSSIILKRYNIISLTGQNFISLIESINYNLHAKESLLQFHSFTFYQVYL